MSRIAVAAALLVVGWSASMSVAYADPAPSTPVPAPGPQGQGPLPGPPQAGTTPPSAEAAAPAGPLTSFGDGTYTVGTQILPGVYQSAGPSEDGACYWKRSNNDGTVANAMSKKPQTVEIEAGDTTFKTSECQEWQKTDAPVPPEPGARDLLGQLAPLIAAGPPKGN